MSEPRKPPSWRIIFDWKVTGIVFGLCAPASIGFLLDHSFIAAYILLGIASACLVAAWIVCPLLTDLRKDIEKPTRFEKRNKIFTAREIDRRRHHYSREHENWLWGGISTILIATACLGAYYYSRQIDYELLQLKGILYPGREQTPSLNCKLGEPPPGGAFTIFLGNTAAVWGNNLPLGIFEVMRMSQRDFVDLLYVNIEKDDALGLHTTVRDKDGKIIATLDGANYLVSQHDILDMQRPSRNAILVRDDYGKKVLDIRYLNSRALRFEGVLRYSRDTYVEIDDDHVWIHNRGNTIDIAGTCWYEKNATISLVVP